MPLYNNGATLGDTTNGKAPNIKGVYDSVLANKTNHTPVASGAFSVGTKTGEFSTNGGQYYRNEYPIDFDASRCSAVYSDSATGIIPAGVYMNICVKY